ncbi:MAG: OsmC family protein [Saprospiraceae bacterium]|nr:OsmC family protein [Saprospiraceae bacterium]
MKSEKISFVNHDGNTLAARMEHPPDQRPFAYAIFAHCFTCNKNLAAVRNISRSLASQGIAVLRFDFQGLGDSDGEFVESNFSTNITDVLAAAAYLADTYEAPSLLVGHSLGGAAALVAGSRLDSVCGIATIGSPANPAHVTNMMKDALDEIENRGAAQVSIGGRLFTISKQFVEDLRDRDLNYLIKNLRKSLLILHSPQDKVVGIENAKSIYQAALHPKSFVSLDGADHILTDKSDSKYVGEVIATWAKRYLPHPDQIDLKTDQQVVARLEEEDKFTTAVRAGQHYLTADEPESIGGNDYGPSPYELLSAGLATCTAMTLRMYTNRKKWPAGDIHVHVQHDKIHAEDCETCSDEHAQGSKIDRLERQIEWTGNLDEKQAQRMLEIANKCPVHKTLETASVIVTKLK